MNKPIIINKKMEITDTEYSAKYGVPLPETCKALMFKKETMFVWGYHQGQKMWLLNIVCSIDYNSGVYYTRILCPTCRVANATQSNILLFAEAYRAPQIHEIVPLLLERKIYYQSAEECALGYINQVM